MRRTNIAALLVAIVGVGACTGDIGDPLRPTNVGGEGTGATIVDFTCGDPAPLIDAPLRRLSRRQLRNTVGDVLRQLMPPGEANGVLAAVEGELGAIPRDQRPVDSEQQTGQQAFYRADQNVGSAAVEAHYGLATALGEALSSDASLDAMGLGCLVAEGTSDAACIDSLVQLLGPVTHRRPLGDDERAFLRDEVYLAGDVVSRDDVRDVITVLFAQPNFLFHVETDGELTPYEAANRLSYHLWDSMPDAELWAAAESGEVLTSTGWEAQVERLLASERARDAIEGFLFEWFRFDQLDLPSRGTGADYEAITAGLEIDESLDDAVVAEIVDLFMHVLRSGGSFEDFFLSEVTPTSHPTLAQIYGVAPAAPGEVVPVPPERRSILARTGLLLSRAEIALPTVNSITHPILRGVFIRRQIACDLLPNAPAGAMDGLPTVDRATTGSREATEILTSAGACAACHSAINPTGFALEGFDAIGQVRGVEPLFDGDGNVTMELAIDDEAVLPESALPVSGAAALADALMSSEKAGACFTRHYVRFSLGRTERLEEDGCILERIDDAVDEGRPLREVMSLVLLDNNFRVRGG